MNKQNFIELTVDDGSRVTRKVIININKITSVKSSDDGQFTMINIGDGEKIIRVSESYKSILDILITV